MTEEIELPENFVRDTLKRASAFGCVMREETDYYQQSRFTAILPDTRLISMQLYLPRKTALIRICQALAPYLDKLEAEIARGVEK